MDGGGGASVSNGVPVYSSCPAYAGIKIYCLITQANVCEDLPTVILDDAAAGFEPVIFNR